MERIINCENLRKFTYVNDTICKKPIKGIVVFFFGLGAMTMFDSDSPEGEYYADKGILYVVPYNNPWAWMNKQAVAYTDEVVDIIKEKYCLPDNIPVVSSGLSMGGQSAIVYTACSRHKPVACVVNCPVCDMVFHYTERNDLPRTLYSALFNEAGTLEEALKTISPLHISDKMPRVKYHIFHCDKDLAVNIDAHSDKLVAELDKRNYDYTYDVVEGRGHCDLTPEMRIKFKEYIVSAIDRSK